MEIDTRTIASGASFTGYAISRDASNNFVANEAVTWSLIDKTGGVADSDLVASGDARSATFTGHVAGTGRIRAQHATLGEDTTGVITVTAVSQPPINVLLKREINRSLFRQEAFHTISWSYNPDNNSLTIISYRIYRKEANKVNDSYQLIGTVSGDTFVYVDGYLDANKKYIYVVTSVESSGHESKFSSPAGN